MVVVVDFGSQTAHLITRRLKEAGVASIFVTPDKARSKIHELSPEGIILSGGPASVYDKGAPTLDAELFSLGIPLLAICYGMQLAMQLLGGTVVSGKKEYGPAVLSITDTRHPLVQGLPKTSTVWMSHGDEVTKLPQGFTTIAATSHVPFALVADEKRKLYGALFHPEVEHTEYGSRILHNFLKLCGVSAKKEQIDTTAILTQIKETVGEGYVIGAVSGGVDSTVAAALAARAIGKRFIPFYVENGLMREGTHAHVKEIFKSLGVPVRICRVEQEMLTKLAGITDPEEKRKTIGAFYITVFEREMEKLRKQGRNVQFLLQGTIYSDVIESKGTKHASKIKSHHNVGGLPKKMQLKLLEPVRTFYKDEVREIGRSLGLPEEFIMQQPFPGPGFAIRVRGEVTAERLTKVKIADTIILEELSSAGMLRDVFQSFAIMTGAFSTAVKGDGRFFGEVVAIRIIESRDVMTSRWSRVPYDILQTMASRIVNEVPGVSRVVYDITTKPPATMEWE